jgi:hypothetical protein
MKEVKIRGNDSESDESAFKAFSALVHGQDVRLRRPRGVVAALRTRGSAVALQVHRRSSRRENVPDRDSWLGR